MLFFSVINTNLISWLPTTARLLTWFSTSSGLQFCRQVSTASRWKRRCSRRLRHNIASFTRVYQTYSHKRIETSASRDIVVPWIKLPDWCIFTKKMCWSFSRTSSTVGSLQLIPAKRDSPTSFSPTWIFDFAGAMKCHNYVIITLVKSCGAVAQPAD